MSLRAFFAPAVVLLAASSPACGGEGGARAAKTDGLGPADASTAVDQCQTLLAYEYQQINNGSFSDGKNPNTAWYVNYDGIEEWTDASAAMNAHPAPEKTDSHCTAFPPAGDAGADYALNLKVSNLKPPIDQPPIGLLPDGAPMPKGGWGCLIGSNLTGDATDASQWDGVSFWIRQTAPAGAVGSAFVSFTDHNTKDPDPTTFHSVPCDQDSDPVTGSTVNQCDSFGMGVAVYPDWKFYALPFAKMRQRGFGKAVPQTTFMQDGIAHLMEVKFDFAPTQDWSIWLDDIAFYKGPEAP